MSDITITRQQAIQFNELIGLCQTLFTTASEREREEAAACIKSLVIGKHITPNGLYWLGRNLRP
ncbi:MAG: hypothetical protein WA210_09080 [Burkholderiaceae bacterium]